MKLSAHLPSLLCASVERDPDHPAFIRRGISTSYGELYRLTNCFARHLRDLGVAKGDRVALVLPNVVEYIVAYYAILRAGAAVVPLCPDTRFGSLSFALNHCQAGAVILGAKNSRLLDGQSEKIPALRLVISLGPSSIDDPGKLAVVQFADLLRGREEIPDDHLNSEELVNSEELASIIYTSGTTAQPKGVMLSHTNLVANARSIVEYLKLSAADTVALVLPFFYSYGNSVLHTHISVGGTIAAVGTMAFPAAVLSGIRDYRCTGLSGVPSTFARLLQLSALDTFDLSSVRYITQAGGPMTPAHTQKLRELLPHATLYVMYGQTEATARLSYLPPEDLARKLGSVGKSIPGVDLQIMNMEGHELPRGTVGEIVARGENIMMGYWQNPTETARVLRPEGLRTGDLAYMDEEGYITIVGRETDMIKSGAHRISPKEIEEVIETLPHVAQCAVVGVPDDLLGEAIAAFVVPEKGIQLTAEHVLRICHDHLPRFKMPSHIRFVDSLPRTSTEKLRRQDLKNWFAAEADQGSQERME